MITTPEEYLKYLYRINNTNPTTIALLLPSTETIYDVDLNTRIINAPEFLSTATDHYAETIYFRVDRFFDNMDLTTTVCLIQYENKNAIDADGKPIPGFVYMVPFYDIEHFKHENKILIPWAIGGPATMAAGPVTFAMRFYKLSSNGEELIYNLNTLPATSKILHGMDVIAPDNPNFIVDDLTIENIYNRINIVESSLGVEWDDLLGENY
jgi:hypothetical protein